MGHTDHLPTGLDLGYILPAGGNIADHTIVDPRPSGDHVDEHPLADLDRLDPLASIAMDSAVVGSVLVHGIAHHVESDLAIAHHFVADLEIVHHVEDDFEIARHFVGDLEIADLAGADLEIVHRVVGELEIVHDVVDNLEMVHSVVGNLYMVHLVAADLHIVHVDVDLGMFLNVPVPSWLV